MSVPIAAVRIRIAAGSLIENYRSRAIAFQAGHGGLAVSAISARRRMR
jgi:hypothetical protein